MMAQVSMPEFIPEEGGVTVIFDVREAEVDQIRGMVSQAGFAVRRYYRASEEHRLGGSPYGWIRLGAERPMREFTDAEQANIVAAFDALQHSAGFTCERLGVDIWTAG
jgi:hypothetical protein